MTLESPVILAVALAMVLAIVAVGVRRRPAMPNSACWLLLAALVLLALAAGRPTFWLPRAPRVVAMVDRSASTRTAEFRNPQSLLRRIEQLTTAPPAAVIEFSNDRAVQTEFSPAQADAIILFSDVQFDLPDASPPVYVVVDPALEQPGDASVQVIEQHESYARIQVTQRGPERVLTINDVTAEKLGAGNRTVSFALPSGVAAVTASFDPADAWPENDAMRLDIATRPLERWWVGSAAPEGWRSLELPTDAAPYLAASVVAINNRTADSIGMAQLDRLGQYVRDLGGGVLIVGGDEAFGAGGYPGTTLESLSPLSSAPPDPVRHWILLADASGSMDQPDQGVTRLQRATEALVELIPRLPPGDLLSVGCFARDVTWWSTGKSVKDTLPARLVPPGLAGRGPTNLQPVLRQLAAQIDGSLASEILVIGDGDASIDDPPTLAQSLSSVRARFHLLATGGAARPEVRRLVELTGGQIVTQTDSRLWSIAAQGLAARAGSAGFDAQPAIVRFSAVMQLPTRSLVGCNTVWLKPDAVELARTETNRPVAAHWRFGQGQVAALAFAANTEEIEAACSLVARQPRDPRFRIRASGGSVAKIRIDATDGGKFVNDLSLTLALDDAVPQPIAQTGPGRYEIVFPSPRQPAIATVREGQGVIDYVALAGRYPAEFERIGNNRDAMRELAARSGGAVIGLAQTTPIPFRRPRRAIPIASLCASAGAILIGWGLIQWKRS